MSPGSIIKLLRTVEGLSQTSLAEHLGVTRAYLSQVENNQRRPGLPFLRMASKTLDIPLPLLLLEEEKPDSEIFYELSGILKNLLSAKLKLTRRNSISEEAEPHKT